MGILSNRVKKIQIKPGDHIYTYRALYTYSQHGIYVGESQVVHFKPTRTSLDSSASTSKILPTCPTFTCCGRRQENNNVVISCLDCFLGDGGLYCFEYGVSPSAFLAKVRGGTCTTAESDPAETVTHRALYLHQNGFGNFDLFQNNCEDFALYCKTGFVALDKSGVGTSSQASWAFSTPFAVLLSVPLKLFMPIGGGTTAVIAGLLFCATRYAADIGVRTDVIKVAVEEVAAKHGWIGRPAREVAE